MKRIDIHQWGWGAVISASLLLGACGSDAASDPYPEMGEICFTARVGDGAETRITGSAWDGDELIGMKVKETTKTYTVDTAGKLSIADEPFLWEGTNFDLLAWCPITSSQILLTDQTTDEKFYDCDLLVSTATVGSKNVHLRFRHQMTRMWWELRTFSGYTQEEMKQAEVTLLGYGSVIYHEGQVTPIGSADQPIAGRSADDGNNRRGEAMMAPCEMWEKPLIRLEIGGDVFTYTPSKANADDADKKKGDLLPGVWQKYYLSVDKGQLIVEMEYDTSIDEWDYNSPDSDKGQIAPV